MKNAIILHGKPTKERYENTLEPKPHEANWLPWLAGELQNEGIDAVIPALPKPYFPVYEDWKNEFEQHHVGDETALVGHSAGAEFILRWLSENRNRKVEKVALVAPYHDFARKYEGFSEYRLDKTLVERAGKLTVFNSLDDDPPIQWNVGRILNNLPDVDIVNFDSHGHFRIGHNMASEEFPELLEELIK